MQGRHIDFFDAVKMQFNMSIMGFVGVFTDDLQDVVVNEITFAPINGQYTVFRNKVQGFSQFYFIEEGDIAVEFDVMYFCVVGHFFTDAVFCFEIILDDKIDGNEQSYADTNQQICCKYHYNGDQERNKLSPSKAPHVLI